MEKMSNTFKAKIWKLNDDIDTDIVLPTEYLALKSVDDMKPYAFSPLRPELAGKNFGCGSSREQAPEVVKALGISCVVAESFARIFFRNAINNGLLLIECPALHDAVSEGDVAEVTPGEKIVVNGQTFEIASLPENLMDILNAGGLVKAMRKRNGLD